MNILIIIQILLQLKYIACNNLNDSEIAETDREQDQYDIDTYLIHYPNNNNTYFNNINLYINNYTSFNHQHLIVDYYKERNLQHLLIELYNDIKFWRNIFIVVGAIITICGCTLNTLCIFIFYKSNLFHNSSFPCYVYVLSVVDTLSLIIRYVIPQASEHLISSILLKRYNATNDGQYEIYTDKIVGDFHCNILMYVHNTLGFASTWLMAAISIERWLVIKYPLQTKSMIKLRAFLILTIIIVVVFIINIFDMAPNFYNKPHWFSNLTLLCEPFDSVQYITLGSLKLNADAYSFIRILLQAVGPFVVALLFNSLIIHNFKRIKSAAYKIKSTSSISVVMSPSHSSACYNNNNNNTNISPMIKHHFGRKRKSSSFVNEVTNEANNLYSARLSQTTLTPNDNNNNHHQAQQYGSKLMPPDSTPTTVQAITQHQTSIDSTNIPNRYSFKRHLSKLRLHRETDVMLIVLSFSILITQLPCTITWYLIYYRLLLTHINDMYLAARSPILIYILRLIEMLYFSMNFIFYITLSPSLRKELKLSPCRLFRKFFMRQQNSTKSQSTIKEFFLASKRKSDDIGGQQEHLKTKFSIFSCLNIFKDKKNLKRNSNTISNNNNRPLIYKIRTKSKENEKFDIKIVIDNYENNNNDDKLLDDDLKLKINVEN
jgi:hypothetical protein